MDVNIVHLTDDMDREISIAEKPQKIISLSPANTEVLFALNGNDKIVGVTDYCDYPEQVKSIEKIGDYINPNIEKIISLEPDLVVANAEHKEIVETLERLDIPTIVLRPLDMENMFQNIELVGKALGEDEYSKELVESLRERMNDVKSRISGIAETDKPKVYYEIWYEPLMTAGPGTFIDDLIKLAGGINIAGEAKTSFPEISLELILDKAPDIFIYSHHGDSQMELEEIYERVNWHNIPAIKNRQIYDIDPNIVQRATPRLIDGLEIIAEILHPDLFK